MVFLVLGRYGEVSKELQSRISGEKDLKILGQWVRQALDVQSIEEFEEKIMA